MNRLTTNKEISEMNMVELSHNSCFAKDRNATYRDFESEIDARDFIRKIGLTFGVFENDCEEMTDGEVFDEVMADYLQYGYDEKEGLLALLYRNLWAQADLYERLKHYEDLEEQGLLLKLPFKVGSTVYLICSRYTKCSKYGEEFEEYNCQGCEAEECDSRKEHYIHTNYSVSIEWIVRNMPNFGKTVFLTQAEAEEALERMERGSENGKIN